MDPSIEKIASSSTPLLTALLLVVPMLGGIIAFLYRENQQLWTKLEALQASRLQALEKFMLEASSRDSKD